MVRDNDQGRHVANEDIHRIGKGFFLFFFFFWGGGRGGGLIEKISTISLLNNYKDNKHSGITGADTSMMMIQNVLEVAVKNTIIM